MAGTTPERTGFDLNRPTIIALIYISVFLTGPMSIVGVVLAYIWRREPHEEWQTSHYSYLIKTFWLGVLLCVGAFALIVFALVASEVGSDPEVYVIVNVLVAFLSLFVGFIWMLVRSAKSLAKAQRHEPM